MTVKQIVLANAGSWLVLSLIYGYSGWVQHRENERLWAENTALERMLSYPVGLPYTTLDYEEQIRPKGISWDTWVRFLAMSEAWTRESPWSGTYSFTVEPSLFLDCLVAEAVACP